MPAKIFSLILTNLPSMRHTRNLRNVQLPMSLRHRLNAVFLNPAIAPRPSAVGGTVVRQPMGGQDVAPTGAGLPVPRALPVGLHTLVMSLAVLALLPQGMGGFAQAATGSRQLTVSSPASPVIAGATGISIRVALENSGLPASVTSLAFKLTYDPARLWRRGTPQIGGAAQAPTVRKRLHTYENPPGSGTLYVVIAGDDVENDPASATTPIPTGDLVTLTFDVLPGAPPGTVLPITLQGVMTSDSAGQSVPVTPVSGGITIQVVANQPPTVSLTPPSLTVTAGQPASFTATVTSGTPPLSYQWQKGTSNITGALSPTYTISSTTTMDTGSYRCVVSNSAGSVPSAAASLSVSAGANQPPTVSIAGDPILVNPITLPATVDLDGTVSDDGLPNPPSTFTTTWSKVYGPSAVTFANTSAVDTTVSFSATGFYILRLTAHDSAVSRYADVRVTVKVEPVAPTNQPPTATAQSITVIEDTPKAITLTGTDPENSPLTFTIATNPTHGSLSGTGANRTYTPQANYTGTDSFTFTVNDGSLTSASATVSMTINAVNDAPTISNIPDQPISSNTATPAVAFTIGDVETPAANLTLTATSSNATLLPVANIVFGGSGANRTVRLTPAANQTGTSTVTVTVSDGTTTATDTLLLTVNSVPSTPWTLWTTPPRNTTVAAKNGSWVQIGTVLTGTTTLAMAIWVSPQDETLRTSPTNFGVSLQDTSCQITSGPWTASGTEAECHLINQPLSRTTTWYLAQQGSSVYDDCNVKYDAATDILSYQDSSGTKDCGLVVYRK